MSKTKVPKFMQKRLAWDKSSGNRILVFKEKHGSRRFMANSPEDVYRACLKILNERFGDGPHNWYSIRKELLRNKELLEIASAKEVKEVLSDSAIAKLPENLQIPARHNNKKFIEGVKSLREDICEAQEMVSAIDNEDGVLACLCLWTRDQYEYENIDFEYLESVD